MTIRHSTARNLATIGCVTAVIGVADAVLAHLVRLKLAYTRSFLGDTVRVLYVENPGAFMSLGAQFPYRSCVWALGLLLALTLAFTVATVIPNRRRLQVIFLGCFCGGGIVNSLTRGARGTVVDYFNLGYGSLRTGVFNIPDLAFIGASIALYAGALMAFLSRPKKAARESNISEPRDPLFEGRRVFKILLVLNMALPILIFPIGLLGILAHEEPISAAQFEDLQVDFDLSGGFLVLTVLLWRSIPVRPIDVVFLRSFASDRGANQVLRSLRKAARNLRITGVRDPKESRHLLQLPLFLLFPYLFAIGENDAINLFGHNAYVLGDWRSSIGRLLSSARSAVFYCNAIGENLAWELARALETHGSAGVFLLVPYGLAIQQVRDEFGAVGVQLGSVPNEQFLPEADLSQLATKLTQRAALVTS